jgi:hypothetical protein
VGKIGDRNVADSALSKTVKPEIQLLVRYQLTPCRIPDAGDTLRQPLSTNSRLNVVPCFLS